MRLVGVVESPHGQVDNHAFDGATIDGVALSGHSESVHSEQRTRYHDVTMPEPIASRAATSSTPEDLFAELFAQVFGVENTRLLVPEYPVEDIYGGSRYVDFALRTIDEQVAFEIDGLHMACSRRPGG